MIKVVISGGGTGGHIFPAIAIANALKSKSKEIDILFIGATGRMEMEKVPAAGYRIEGLTISGFQRRLTLKNLSFPFKLVKSLLKARSILKRFNPDVVIGVGGYASGPTLRMAARKHIPCLIQEQNSFPGVTNRILSDKVSKICVAYEGMEKYFPKNKIVFTGNPIRHDVTNIQGKRDKACIHFGLKTGMQTLLVMGGSLGAGTINKAIQAMITNDFQSRNFQIIWQTGTYYYKEIRDVFSENQLQSGNLVLVPFIDRMDLAYAAADLIVSRAGAIAISELCVVGKPVILVPSPNVAEDHQTKNAKALTEKNAAILVPDTQAVEILGKTIFSLFDNQGLRDQLGFSIKKLGIIDAADTIANEALALIPASVRQHPSHLTRQASPVTNFFSVYFLGIGGIGMSALARYFLSAGLKVSGYDKTPSALTDQLSSEGMKIHFHEDPALIPANPDLVIYTPAIPGEHAELMSLKAKGIALKKRAEVLGMISRRFKTIAVAGTHGKTTTSTMIAHILASSGVPSLAFLGGISRNYNTNFLNINFQPDTGENDSDIWCVVEADEFDRSFLHLSPQIAVITSVDADHLDIYGDHDDLKRTFSDFTGNIVQNGSLVIKRGLEVNPQNSDTYKISNYSAGHESSYYPIKLRVTDALFHFDLVTPQGIVSDLVLGVPGRFNLENAVAALAVGIQAGISHNDLRKALQSYQGVQRRFEFRIRREDTVYIDDYAHHPEELKACISAVRDLFPGKRITGVFQPHLFSRTRDFADEFAASLDLLDELLLLDIYPARELPIPGVTSQMLLDRMTIPAKKLVEKPELLAQIGKIKPEILITMGAGDIDRFVEPITNLLNQSS